MSWLVFVGKRVGRVVLPGLIGGALAFLVEADLLDGAAVAALVRALVAPLSE